MIPHPPFPSRFLTRCGILPTHLEGMDTIEAKTNRVPFIDGFLVEVFLSCKVCQLI